MRNLGPDLFSLEFLTHCKSSSKIFCGHFPRKSVSHFPTISDDAFAFAAKNTSRKVNFNSILFCIFVCTQKCYQATDKWVTQSLSAWQSKHDFKACFWPLFYQIRIQNDNLNNINHKYQNFQNPFQFSISKFTEKKSYSTLRAKHFEWTKVYQKCQNWWEIRSLVYFMPLFRDSQGQIIFYKYHRWYPELSKGSVTRIEASNSIQFHCFRGRFLWPCCIWFCKIL